jgi:hypothetical protein
MGYGPQAPEKQGRAASTKKCALYDKARVVGVWPGRYVGGQEKSLWTI